jgi:hypothetical protein
MPKDNGLTGGRIAGGEEAANAPLEPGFYKGIRNKGEPLVRVLLTPAERRKLNDPIARLILGKGLRPPTLPDLLAELDKNTETADDFSVQKVYLAGERGQLPVGEGSARGLRFIVTRSRPATDPPDRFAEANVLISTNAIGRRPGFLQAIGWDDDAGTFNFYELIDTSWSWAGNSEHALRPPTRGAEEGPFDSHINGTLVMKELRFPWIHWHSVISGGPFPASLLDGNALDLDGPNELTDAELLEQQVVVPGVQRSVTVRLDRVAADGEIREPRLLLRHLFEGTTINLVTSTMKSASVIREAELPLPRAFFLAHELLGDPRLGLGTIGPAVVARGQDYLDAIEAHGVRLAENGFEQRTDSFFAFIVPGRAFEDDEVILQMVHRKWLSSRFVGCAAMVDFPNPIFSQRRASLMQFVPADRLAFNGTDGETKIVDAILAAADADATSAAADFARLWHRDPSKLADTIGKIVNDYGRAVQAELRTREGYFRIFDLAEWRRHEFARQPLREFPLTMPVSDVPENTPALEMTPTGTVRPRTS